MAVRKGKSKEKETKDSTKEGSKAKEEPIQPEINIGLVGHVDHGKTTLTERMSGKWADTHSEELKRGITIRLGYADCELRKCSKCKGDPAYTTKGKCPICGKETKLLKKISIVDAPGHESLMATMLSGATIMDGALLLIAANEECPQPQSKEHLTALEIIGVKNIVVVQNKIDLVSREDALKNYKQIKRFLTGTPYKDAPIIPVSAQHRINIDVLIKTIHEEIPTPKRDEKASPLMVVARSFDINKPGTKPEKVTGGIIGGALKQGKLSVGDEIEILPGYKAEDKNQAIYKPLKTVVIGLMTGGKEVNEVLPGGSIAVLTQLDPSVTQADKLSGSVAGHPGKLPDVWYGLNLKVHLLKRVVGVKDALVVDPVKMTEPLMLNVYSTPTVGIVTSLSKEGIKCKLKLPVCADIGARVTISRRLGNRWRLIGYGVIKE